MSIVRLDGRRGVSHRRRWALLVVRLRDRHRLRRGNSLPSRENQPAMAGNIDLRRLGRYRSELVPRLELKRNRSGFLSSLALRP